MLAVNLFLHVGVLHGFLIRTFLAGSFAERQVGVFAAPVAINGVDDAAMVPSSRDMRVADARGAARSQIVRRHSNRDVQSSAGNLFNLELTARGTAASHGKRNSYEALVLADNPLAYWRLGGPNDGSNTTAALGRAGQAVDGIVEGDPEFQTQSLIPSDPDAAMLFTGSTGEVVRIPNSTLINSGDNYTNRTIEFWFKATGLTVAKQTLYDEGDDVRGISIFVNRKPGFEETVEDAPGILSLFVYNRGDGEIRFGMEDPNLGAGEHDSGGPITCEFEEGKTYYVALVFEGGDSPAPRYQAFYRGPGNIWTVHACGDVVNLPKNAVLRHHSEPPCLGSICGKSRHSPAELVQDTHPSESDHKFRGTIDEVAIYDTSLPRSRMDIHAIEAMA